MLNNSILYLSVVFCGMLLTSCQASNPISHMNTVEPREETIAHGNSSTPTDLISTLVPVFVSTTIPTPTATLLPSQTPKPNPSPTSLSLERLQERGALWILLNYRTSYFLRLNLDNGEISPIRASDICDAELLPGTEQVVCGFPGQYILRNLVTGGDQPLPIENTCRFYGWSPNGRFLLYEYCIQDGSYKLATYDLVTQREQEVVSLSKPYEEREWNTIPIISYDGKHLIVGGRTVYEIDQKTSERSQIGISEPLTTWDIALSPTANQVVYGTSDIEQEIGLKPNHLYLYDFDSGENSLLATAPEGEFYDWFFSNSIWSPDGKQVVVTNDENLCVIDVTTRNQNCHDLSPYEVLNFMEWSPGSQYIALDAGYWGNPISDLIIFDVAKGTFIVLLSELEIEAETLEIISWR